METAVLGAGNENLVNLKPFVDFGLAKKIGILVRETRLGKDIYSLISCKGKFFLMTQNGDSFPGLEEGFDGIVDGDCNNCIRSEVTTAVETMRVLEKQPNRTIPDFLLIVKGNQVFYATSEKKVERMKTLGENVKVTRPE